MARIRTIKPDFFRHEALYEAERDSNLPLRVAFAGLWTAADREGRFAWRPRVLKLDVLPFDDIDFGKVLDTLTKYGFVVKYEVAGEVYGYIPSWPKHQHVNQREAESSLPAPDSEGARTCMHIPARGEGKGREGEQEGKGTEIHVPQERDRSPVERVFEHWRSEHKHPRAHLDAKRRRLIQARLSEYDEPTLCAAISGYKNSPHHMGQNDRNTVYDDIELFLRDAKRVEQGLTFARGPPAAPKSAVELARERLRKNGSGDVVSEQSGDGSVGQAPRLLRG